MKLIYAYVKKENNKVVYVGQTYNLSQRRQQHEKNEAFNPERNEYKFPLSRAIRKYGIEAFDCIILEKDIPLNKINEREQYWIKYYNTYHDGYNQTPGGDAKIEITEQDILDIYDMLKSGLTYEKISKNMNICIALISMINNGLAYQQPGYTYPIIKKKFGKRLPEKVVNEVIQLLINKEIKVRDIAKIYNIGFNVVVRINSGECYHRDDLKYPLRTGRVRESKNINYQELLNKTIESLTL